MGLVIAKSRLWPKIGHVPNKAQRHIHASKARHVVTAAGRRLGKSTAGGLELLPEVYRTYLQKDYLQEEGLKREFWAVGPQYTDAEKEFRAFYNACRKLKMPFDKPGTYYDKHGGDLQVSLWGGTFLFHGQSAKYPEHLVGEGLHGVLMCEAAKMKKRIWEQYIRATLADFRGWSRWNSTPEGRNWFYEIWQKGQHGDDPDWESFRFPSWLNERIYPMGMDDPEILSLRRDLSEEFFSQEIEAKFGKYVGRVFKDWDEEWHVNKDVVYNPAWPLFIAADYGWTNPNAILFIQVDPWDRVYVIDEYYLNHRSPEEVADDLERGTQSSAHPSLVRAATRLYGDPADPAATHTISERLRLQAQSGTGGEIKDRLELIRKWLKDENDHLPYEHPERRPRLRVSPKCKMTIAEMDAYRYPKTRDEQIKNEDENPMKKDDHTPEALGRFFISYFGKAAISAAPVVRKVRTSRGPRAAHQRRRAVRR